MTQALYDLSFGGLALLTVASVLLMIGLRNILHSAIALFFALTGVAGLYVLLGADFLAAAQLLIYAGGVLVLIIFGIFLTTQVFRTKIELSMATLSNVWSLLLSAGLFVLLCVGIYVTDWPESPPHFEPTVAPLGDLLLSKFLLPFEIVSILLLFALVGAIILVRKELKGDRS